MLFDNIPAKSRKFLQKNCDGHAIVKCEKQFASGDYEISLADGIAMEFDAKGNMTEIEAPDGYSLSPQAVGTDAYATETRLTITVRVKYTDNKNPAKNMDQSFSAYRQFSSDLMLTDVQDDLCREISEELVNLIFNATLGDW